MRALKALTALAVIAAVIWCGYWFVGARALERTLRQGLARSAEVEVQDLVLRGFPNRFDVTFTEPRIRAAGVEWGAPFVQFFALSYKLNHLIAVFAHDQFATLGGVETTIHSADLRGSLVLEPGLDLPLEALTLVGADLDLMQTGATQSIDRLRLASRRTGAREHQLVALAEGVFPDPAMMDRIDPERLWPRRFDRLRLDAEAEFDRPLDRHLFDGIEPALARLTLTGAEAAWTGVDIAVSGRLTPDATGALTGDVTAAVTGWRDLLATLGAAGLLTPELQATLASTLGTMAEAAEGDRLIVPLSVVSGEVRLGPLWLGLLPRLVTGARAGG